MEMYMRFQNIFKQKCTEMDKKIAITCYTELKNIEEISYRDLLYCVDSLIFNLTNIGMKSGMRIIIIPEYNIDTYIYTIALACMGITIVALDKDTPMQLLEKEITELKPAAIIASKKVYDIKFIDISISVIELKSDVIQWIRKIDNYNIYCEYHDIIAILYSSGIFNGISAVSYIRIYRLSCINNEWWFDGDNRKLHIVSVLIWF